MENLSNTPSLIDTLSKNTNIDFNVNEIVKQFPLTVGATSVEALNENLENNNLEVTKLFCETLGKQHALEPAYFAAKLKTKAAEEIVWDYIKEKKYDEDYQTILLIVGVAKEIVKITWVCEPVSFFDQTESGFFLHFSSLVGITHIATPFGRIELRVDPYRANDSILSEFGVLINRLNATFHSMGLASGLSGSGKSKEPIYEVQEGEKIEIAESELQSKEGSKNVIYSQDYYLLSKYAINNVAGKALTVPTMKHEPTSSSKNYDLTKYAWKLLESKFSKI